MPKTREQLEEWGAYWPISWRPPGPDVQQHTEPSAAEVAAMRQHMRRAWELALGSAERGGVANACLIVEPGTGLYLAAL